MKNIDYKIFVPRAENNHVRFSTTEFEIDDILTVNLHVGDDRVTYWFYFRIPVDDEHHKLILRKGEKPKTILFLGNNPYEIHGEAEVVETSLHKWEDKIQITLSLVVVNASQTLRNPVRQEVEYSRSEILDIRENDDILEG